MDDSTTTPHSDASAQDESVAALEPARSEAGADPAGDVQPIAPEDSATDAANGPADESTAEPVSDAANPAPDADQAAPVRVHKLVGDDAADDGAVEDAPGVEEQPARADGSGGGGGAAGDEGAGGGGDGADDDAAAGGANAGPREEREAILYLPGLRRDADTIEAVAHRVALAMDNNDPAATYSAATGETAIFAGDRARKATVMRKAAGGKSVGVLDVYEFDYRGPLVDDFGKRSPVYQGFQVLATMAANTRNFIAAVKRRGQSVPQKLQVLYGGMLMSSMVLYILLLLLTATATAKDGVLKLSGVVAGDSAATVDSASTRAPSQNSPNAGAAGGSAADAAQVRQAADTEEEADPGDDAEAAPSGVAEGGQQLAAAPAEPGQTQAALAGAQATEAAATTASTRSAAEVAAAGSDVVARVTQPDPPRPLASAQKGGVAGRQQAVGPVSDSAAAAARVPTRAEIFLDGVGHKLADFFGPAVDGLRFAAEVVWTLFAGIVLAVWRSITWVWATADRYTQELQTGVASITILGLAFRFNLKETLARTSGTTACISNYLAYGVGRPEIVGQMARLLEHMRADEKVRYTAIHVVGYSFGSVVAIDCIYQDSEVSAAFDDISTLTTIGCPADFIRTYWRDYFVNRHAPSRGVEWLNVYAAADVLASNFQDGKSGGMGAAEGFGSPAAPERVNGVSLCNHARERLREVEGVKSLTVEKPAARRMAPADARAEPGAPHGECHIVPNDHVFFGHTSPSGFAGWMWFILAGNGFKAHRSYWPDGVSNAKTCWEPLVKRVCATAAGTTGTEAPAAESAEATRAAAAGAAA